MGSREAVKDASLYLVSTNGIFCNINAYIICSSSCFGCYTMVEREVLEMERITIVIEARDDSLGKTVFACVPGFIGAACTVQPTIKSITVEVTNDTARKDT